MPADLIVVGGGPAGLATAICARRAGLAVTVVDKRTEPLDKACGEGLMPSGVRELQTMGVSVPEWGRYPFEGIRYVDGDTVATGRFGSGPGLGVRRTALAEGLLSRARALGAEIRLGTTMRSWQRHGPGDVEVTTDGDPVRGRILVAADGLHSRIRRRAGLARRRPAGRFGVRRHFACEPWSRFVEVHWSDDAEAYVTPAGPALIGVALLWNGKNERFDTLLSRFPALRQKLAGAGYASRDKGAGPFRQQVSSRVAEDLALVGDSAGYLDPLTGEGMTLAFRSARALVDTVAAGRPLGDYERAYRELSRNYYRMTGLLLRVAARPRLRRRVVRMLARRPDLFSTLLAVTAGEEPVTAVGLGGVARMIGGLVRG